MRTNLFIISLLTKRRIAIFRLLLTGLIISSFLNLACLPRRTTLDAIYLIPQGYEGVVIVLFDQPDGVEPETEDWQYVYKIPADGLLRVKTHGQGGLIIAGKKYFYVNENGERQPLEYLESEGYVKTTSEDSKKSFDNISEEEKNNVVFVMYRGGIGSFNINNEPVRYSSFLVGKPKNVDLLHRKKRDWLFDIQKNYKYPIQENQ